jgi:amino acid transporter
LSYGRFFLFLWTWLLSYGKFLDLIKSWESSHRLNLIVSLLVAISLLICLIAFCFFLFVGVDDAVHVSEEIDEVGITGEVTVVSPP